MKNVKTETSVTEFVQTVFKYVKIAQINLIFQQIIQAWMKLNLELCQNISESTNKILISNFLQLLQIKKNVWKNIILQIEKVNCQWYQNMQNIQNMQDFQKLVYKSQKTRDDYYKVFY